MILTEKEARTKWCPQSQVSGAASGGASGEWWNRPHQEGEAQFRCMASDCMAWRVTDRRYFDRFGRSQQPDSAHIDHSRTVEIGGYCGLAGKP